LPKEVTLPTVTTKKCTRKTLQPETNKICIYRGRDKPTNSTEQPSTMPSQEKTTGGERGELSGQIPTTDKGKAPVLEHFHTPVSLGNMLAWGGQ
jgi:hypothetical protein